MDTHTVTNDLRRVEFDRLFQQHEQGLYGYIFSLVPNVAAADEIGQETSLVLWKEFNRADPIRDFGAWARTIAYYQVLAYRKTAKRERLRFDSELLDVLADRAAARWDELLTRQDHLTTCLSGLSEFKQQVLRFYYSFEMTAKTIAERLGRNVAVVEKTLVRSRLSLRECIEAAMRREDHR
jgi:RNA polymerase sigma-70 factor (ECF subfamily)